MNFVKPVSPLRYPGGKRKLAHVVHQLLELDEAETGLLVEPFMGGGAVTISFLENTSSMVAIADADPLVSAFWSVVFSEAAVDLADLIEETEPDLDLWLALKNQKPNNLLALAYKCLVLNRTSFSGIMNGQAGPIGGIKQQSEHTISCRFNATALSKRITELSEYRDRVLHLGCQDWRKTVSAIRRKVRGRARSRLAWYLDPPFFEKADRLYARFFNTEDHEKLRRELDRLPGRYVLSYDDVPAARAMYRDHPGFLRINLSYNARVDRHERLVAGEMLVSDIIARLRKKGALAPMGQLVVMPEKGRASQLTIRTLSAEELPVAQAAHGGTL
ncbi:MAG: DNA adenine methylase [Niveispirillum sp.]|nr:DNA adenine methylase [Niveispirillum sp.]